MTVSSYIAEASRRAALPIGVKFFTDGGGWVDDGFWFINSARPGSPIAILDDDAAKASRFYLLLVASLSNPDATPSSGRESCSTNSSAPEGAGT